MLIARWEAKGGKQWIELLRRNGYYVYEGNACGGHFTTRDDETAIAWMERPWGHGAGPVTVLRTDFPSVKRVS